MKKRKTNYLYIIISILQTLMLLMIFLFEYLSKKKPLVMRHLYTRKLEHLNTILNDTNRNVFSLIIIVILVFLVFLMIKKANVKIQNFIFSVIIVCTLVSMLTFDLFSKNITFTYSIGILLLVCILDIVKLFVKIRFINNYKLFS